MTTFLLIVALLVILALLYAFVGRQWLKRQSWTRGFFAWIEPAEIALFKKSETVLAGRLMWAGGLVVTFYDGIAVFASSLDWTPVTSRLMASIPEDLRGLILTGALTGIGYLIVWLRKRTSKPLETVAIAEKDITPAVQQALDVADIAKDQAVAAVADAKAA